MISLILMEDGSAIAEGLPEFFVRDEDFSKLLHEKEEAKRVFKFFGRRVCIGRLGCLENGVYREANYSTKDFGNGDEKSGVSFYEKIPGDF